MVENGANALPIDLEEDKAARAMLVGMPRETERSLGSFRGAHQEPAAWRAG